MKLYGELADWFHLLTAPEDYAEEAVAYRDAIRAALPGAKTLLELGAGGGNNASHLKRDFVCVLTDLSPAMLAQSAKINPECEHVPGDMRTLRLGRTFDAVLVHDAVVYLLEEEDLRAAMETAWTHLRPGGVAIFAADYYQESFRVGTDHGGHDGADGRGLRYLEWVHPLDRATSRYVVDYVVILRERDGSTRFDHDRHEEAAFPRATWERLFAEVGF